MSYGSVKVPPFDPSNISGAARMESGVVRMGVITPGSPYASFGDTEYARWLYVGVTGNVSIICYDGSTIILPNLATGIWHPIFTIGVNASGTTASGLMWGS